MGVGLINKGTTVQICVTPQNTDLLQAAFAALTYVDICCLTEVPTVGEEAEIVTQFCISGDEQTAVGASAGSEFDLSMLYKSACIGQDTLRNGAVTQDAWAIRIVRPDGVVGVTTPTTIYTRAMITSKMFGSGDINEMIADVYSAKITQKPIFVKPAPV